MSPRPTLSLDAIYVVDAIARHGSFAKAAAELHKVPSALSYTVAQHGAAAGGGQSVVASEFQRRLSLLAIAEASFAVAFEDVGDADAGRGLDGLIEVDEGEAEAVGEAPIDGGLAGTHRADEKEVSRGSHATNGRIRRSQP